MKTNTILLLIIATILFVAITPTHAQGNLIVNGGFDTTNSWTLSSLAYFNVKNGTPLPDVVLQGTSSSSLQPISLTQGIDYLITGDYRPYVYRFGGLRVGFNNGIVYEISLPTNNYEWSSFSFRYTAPAGISFMFLSFKGIGQCEIDNIGVYAVPEPHYISFGILAAVLIIVVYFLRRNPKR